MVAQVATQIPPEVGFVVRVEAGPRSAASLALLEESYAADASQVTWRGATSEGAQIGRDLDHAAGPSLLETGARSSYVLVASVSVLRARRHRTGGP